MQHITKWKDIFGDENAIMLGKDDDVYIVFPNQRDEEGNSKVIMIPKNTILEFAEKIKEQTN